MKPWTLRRRIVVGTGAVTVILVVVLAIVVRVLLIVSIQGDVDRALEARGEAALSTLSYTDGKVAIAEASSDRLFDTNVWVYVDGVNVERAIAPADLQTAADALGSATSVTTVPGHDGGAAFRAVPFDADGVQRATVVVALSTENYHRTLVLSFVITVVIGVGAVAGTMLLAAWLVRAALRPVTRMAARATDWHGQDIPERLSEGPVTDEISGLATSLDGLLDRIRAVLTHERRFTAELAHQLRTPARRHHQRDRPRVAPQP